MSNSNKTPASAVEKNENEIANRETEGRSQRQIIINRFVKHKAAMGSLFVALVLFGLTLGIFLMARIGAIHRQLSGESVAEVEATFA